MNFIRIYRSSAVGRFADWASLIQLVVAAAGLCGGGALVTLAFSTIEPIMNYGWGAVIILGITTTCIIIATLSLAAFACRAIFPSKFIRSPSTPPEEINLGNDHASLITEMDAVKSIIAMHHKDFNDRFKFASQQIGKSIERIGVIESALAAPKATSILSSLGMESKPANNKFEDLDMKIDALRNRCEFIDKKFEEFLSKLSDRTDQLQEDTYQTFKKIQQVITAERVYESYNRMVEDITLQADKLEDPLSKQDIYGDWKTWEAEYNVFRNQLVTLERFINTHAGISLNLFEVPPEKYASANWTYNFKNMNDDQKISYKTYRIILRNFVTATEGIKSKLYTATFFNL